MKVLFDEVKGIAVDTYAVMDEEEKETLCYETQLIRLYLSKVKVVERYYSEKDAESGHDKIVEEIKNGKKYEDFEDLEKSGVDIK